MNSAGVIQAEVSFVDKPTAIVSPMLEAPSEECEAQRPTPTPNIARVIGFPNPVIWKVHAHVGLGFPESSVGIPRLTLTWTGDPSAC